jgi:hexosaminidase
MSAFYTLFYGAAAANMGRVYQLMSRQAQFWSDSWDTAPSKARKPIFGNSESIYNPPRPARDQTLPLPSVPSAENLAIASKWSEENQKRLGLASDLVTENEELLGLLYSNLQRVEFNRYNLEVFVSVAQLCRQNLRMVQSLAAVDRQLEAAQTAAAKGDARQATAALDRALDLTLTIKDQRNRALQETVETWYKSWFPRVAEANGRRFLHELDDVKDHLPDRTVDMSYLIYRQLLLPLGVWYDQVQSARNSYAKKHELPLRHSALKWSDTGL